MRISGMAELKLPKVGFGGAPIGNLHRRIEDEAARSLVREAVANGLRFVDTAPHYGRGLSERRIGDALRGRASDVVISTKVGRLLQPDPTASEEKAQDGFLSDMPFSARYDYSYDGVLRSFEASLHRLGLDHVDILFVHDIGRLIHSEKHDIYWNQLTAGGGFRALQSLRDQEIIRGFGVGVNEVEVCLDVLGAADVDLILLAGRYTLLEQDPLHRLFPACDDAGVSIVVGGPYNSGILATGTAGGTTPMYDYAAAPRKIIDRVARLQRIAHAYRIPLAAAALQFPLAHPAVSSVIPGIADFAQLGQTLAYHAWPIPGDFWAELKAGNLLDRDAPVPTDVLPSAQPEAAK